MDWTHPRWLLWLWAGPLVAGFWAWAFHDRKQSLLRFAEAGLLAHIANSADPRQQWAKAVLATAGLLLLVVALAGPQWGFQWQPVKRKAVDILVAVDVSNSMLAEDVSPNRLERAKLAVRDLVERLQGERIGLIAFAGSSFIQCPLTVDYDAFQLTLEDLFVGTIPRGSTGLEQMVDYSIGGFSESEPSKRILIIFSDGEEHFGKAALAADKAAEAGLTIHTVGMGTEEGELIPIPDAQGNRTFLKDETGRTVKTRLRENILKQIAASTGGSYIRSTTDPRWLEIVYGQEGDSAQAESLEGPMRKRPEKRFQWPLAFALMLLAAEGFLERFRRAAA